MDHRTDSGCQRATLSAEVADFIAEKTEGNLLATLQEIQKLTLLCQKPEIDLNDVIDAVSDVSRFDQEALFIAFLEGDAGRVSKIIDSLEAENIQIPSFLWRLSDDVRRMILHKQGRKFARFGIDNNHVFALQKAAGRTTLKRLGADTASPERCRSSQQRSICRKKRRERLAGAESRLPAARR